MNVLHFINVSVVLLLLYHDMYIFLKSPLVPHPPFVSQRERERKRKSRKEREGESKKKMEGVGGGGQNERGRETEWTTKEKMTERKRKSWKGREGEQEKKWRGGQNERGGESEQRKKKGEGGREREKSMLGIYCATKCTRHCIEWSITPKVSPHLPSISSNHASHSINDIPTGHPQHTIKPHFHSVSISMVIFHTAHRATGSSSFVFSKQYRISV